MQQATQAAPASPAAPAAQAAPAAPAVAQATTPSPAIQSQLIAMQTHRTRLLDQIEELGKMRQQLQEQRDLSAPQNRSGLDGRIAAIDQRTGSLERQLFQVDDQINRLTSTTVTVTGGREVRVSQAQTVMPDGTDLIRAVRNEIEDAMFGAVAATATFFVFATLAWRGFRRWIWKRKPAPAVSSGTDHSTSIAQLQQSMDVIAVEVERISEAQRYVAKLLNDRTLAAGEAQPVSREREPEHLRAEKRY
jgi:hypothetical protein